MFLQEDDAVGEEEGADDDEDEEEDEEGWELEEGQEVRWWGWKGTDERYYLCGTQ